MKLCITANGSNLDSSTNTTFGRAPWLLYIDTDSMDLQAMENSAANASQGAGIGAAQLVADNGAAAVLTGRVGPKAEEVLQAAGIKIYEGLTETSVKSALQQFNEGNFSTNTNSGGQTMNNRNRVSSTNGCRRAGGSGRGMGRGNGMGNGGGMGRGGCRGNGTGNGAGMRRSGGMGNGRQCRCGR
ncbi:MAG TPA: dinitrogenase iron-molybdenum cofactor biosynthesis protein [Desulfobacterales bacterium]|nr:dinitrogenase iron-molybdenum cofactor biosynthesis protein [Desulfobacterales bacterium]